MPTPEDLTLSRRAVAQGFCQQNEVEECLEAVRQNERSGTLQPLADILVERGYMTRSQLSRLEKTGAQSQSVQPGNLRLGSYELLLKLGEGGMGAVYKANDTRNGKIVAIKVLPRSKAKDEMFLKRFEMEARATFELDHPNIVHGYEVGNSDGYHYLVIEFVQGYDLCALLEQRGRFTESEALVILEQMAKALDHIHTSHLIHRDIKPENILVGEDGVAKLTDMGLTIDDPAQGRRRRLTEAGIAMGTPFYLSPEQIKGEGEVDIRSDIYALGATTYEMITGRPPFEGDTPAIVMLKHVNEYVPSPHDLDRTISFNFCHLLERMMAKDPFHRYQTPFEMLQDIRRVIRGKEPMGIRPPVGRSSCARPELHQHSRRVQPIESRRNRDERTSSEVLTAIPPPGAPRRPAAPLVIPTAARNAGNRQQSSNSLPAVTSSSQQRAQSSHALPAVPAEAGVPARSPSSKRELPPPEISRRHPAPPTVSPMAPATDSHAKETHTAAKVHPTLRTRNFASHALANARQADARNRQSRASFWWLLLVGAILGGIVAYLFYVYVWNGAVPSGAETR